MIRILFFGDIVGQAGRNIVTSNISSLRESYKIDLVIANGENAAHGKGITEKIYKQLVGSGVDVITMGNHTFAKSTIYNFIENSDRLIRPLNMEPLNVGRNHIILDVKGKKICIFNVIGDVFMVSSGISPFDVTRSFLDEIKADIYFCDFHGEATSEKILYAFEFQKIIQIVVGTHTHVQTADERIIGKTAFISDVGMCGVYHSVLGRDVDETLARLVYRQETHFKVAEGPAILCAVVVEIDEESLKAVNIERIQIRPNEIIK